MSLGWHYLLDLIWILRELGEQKNLRILDVGAGLGLLQFILAERGHRVISADMRVRQPSLAMVTMYQFDYMGTEQAIEHSYLAHHGLKRRKTAGDRYRGLLDTKLGSLPGKFLRTVGLARTPAAQLPPSEVVSRPKPTITLYRCDASDMRELKDRSIDAVVSVSALEHNPPELAARIAREAKRTVREGGLILHTVSASFGEAREHPESHSHLLDEEGLARVYELHNHVSNFQDIDKIKASICDPCYLRRWLSHNYFRDGRNGMPWGVWKPEYLPVGLRSYS